MLGSYRGPNTEYWYKVYVVYVVNGERKWTTTLTWHHSIQLALMECATILDEGITDQDDGSDVQICKLAIRRFDNVAKV